MFICSKVGDFFRLESGDLVVYRKSVMWCLQCLLEKMLLHFTRLTTSSCIDILT